MDNLHPQADLTLTLVKVARLYRQGVDEALSGLGLSDALALPVVLLGRRPDGVRQNQLADELGVEGPSLVRLLDRLVQTGLVERREDPFDRPQPPRLPRPGRLSRSSAGWGFRGRGRVGPQPAASA
jgi:CRP-like cAMP-binding protein